MHTVSASLESEGAGGLSWGGQNVTLLLAAGFATSQKCLL